MNKLRIKEIDGQIYLSQPEIGERRGVHSATIDNWRTKYGLPGRRVGGRWYYAETAFYEWEKSRA